MNDLMGRILQASEAFQAHNISAAEKTGQRLMTIDTIVVVVAGRDLKETYDGRKRST